MENEKVIPIFILSGFLGSGKTTLLLRLIAQLKESNLLPAVIMNEIGEVSLDGAVIQEDVPMEEIMNGCICCSVRGELSQAIRSLVEDHAPDVILVEATGLANPMELVEGVTDTSLVMKAELHSIITVVDADHFYSLTGKRGHTGSERTLLLLEDQIRAANDLILNKIDTLQKTELQEAVEQIRSWNEHAVLHQTTYAQVSLEDLGHVTGAIPGQSEAGAAGRAEATEATEHSHDHVTVYTHYFTEPVNEKRFERFIASLPSEIYRAKGFLTFSEHSGERTLFQYAYGKLSMMNLSPKRSLPDVIVLMGESISKSRMKLLINQLTSKPPAISKKRSMAAANLQNGLS